LGDNHQAGHPGREEGNGPFDDQQRPRAERDT
jgi:hypothetical protein